MAVRRPLIAALILLVLATAFWGLFWHQSAESVLTRVPLLDENWYLHEAARLRTEGGPGDVPFVMSPGYPLLVALSGGEAPSSGVLAAHPRGLLAVQALAWIACGLLVGSVVHRAGRRAELAECVALTVGIASALLFLLYRPAAIYARTVLLEVPLTALVTAALVVAVSARPGVIGRAVLAGVCLGLAASLRAHVLVLLIVLLPAIWAGGANVRRRVAAASVLVVLALLPVILASVHNTRTTGRLAGPSFNAGVNLYLGQQPAAGGLFTTLEGFDLASDPSGTSYLSARLGRVVDGPAEADRLWRAEARDLVARAPGRALAGWLRKVWLHAQGWEVAQVTPLAAWPEEAPVLRLLPVPWSLLVILAVSGGAACLAASGERARQAAFWLVAVALVVSVQSLFFVVSRYRLVLSPALAVLAGLGCVALLSARGAQSRRRRLASAGALVAALLLTVPWGLDAVQKTWRGLEDLNLARRLLVVADPGHRDRADTLLASACGAVPGRTAVWQLRAENLVESGRPDGALTVLADGILQVSEPAALERMRISLLRGTGRLDQAEALAQAYLRDEPDDLDMLHDLAVMQGERGHWTSVEATARRLQAVAPADHRGWLDLAVALARQQRREDAMAVLRAGLDQVVDPAGRSLLEENLRRLEGRTENR